MRTATMAAVAMGLWAGAGAAATMPPGDGYAYVSDDGAVSFFVEAQPGEDFLDLMADGSLEAAFLLAYATYDNAAYVHEGALRFLVDGSAAGGLQQAVGGQVCDFQFDYDAEASIDFVTGDLDYYFLRVDGVANLPDGSPCEVALTDDYLPASLHGRWSVVGNAAPYPFSAAVPLPASALGLLAGLGALGLARRRR